MTLESILDFIFSNIWFLIIIFWFLAPLFRGGKGKPQDRRRSGLPGQPGREPGHQPTRQPDRQLGRQLSQPTRPDPFGRPGQPGQSGQFELPPIYQPDQAGNWQGGQAWEQQRQASDSQRHASQPRREKEFGWPGKEVSNPTPFPKLDLPKFPWEEEKWQWEQRDTRQSPVGHTAQKVEHPTVSDMEEEYPPFVIVTDDKRDMQFGTDRKSRQDNREEGRQEDKRHSNRPQPDKHGAQETEKAKEGAEVSFPFATDLLPSASQAVQGMIWSQIFGPPKGLESRRSNRYNPYTRRR